MNAKAAPAPGWHPAMLNSQIAVSRLGADHFRALIIGDGVLVAAAFGRSEEEARTNAKRISALPDLMDAVTFILDHITDPQRKPIDLYPAFGLDARRAIEKARAAIVKAGVKP